MRYLGLVISPGRCGTAALAAMLEGYGDPRVICRHESLTQLDTRPNVYFRAYDDETQSRLASEPRIASWLTELDSLDHDSIFIDTGWTLYPLVPLLIERYRSRVRLLHVVRHPIQSAASAVLHGLYDPRQRELSMETYESFIRPWAPRTFHPELAASWKDLTVFERNLFRVCEINEFGLELDERYPDVPTMRVHLEDLHGEKLAGVVAHFGLMSRASPPVMPKANESRDRMRGLRPVGEDWRHFWDHPWAVDLAERLGFPRQEQKDFASKMKRYQRQGVWDHVLGAVYRVPATRRAWRFAMKKAARSSS